MTDQQIDSDVKVVDNPGESRYEIWVDGTLAGFTVYELKPDAIEFIHTEIGDEFGGRGLGSKLVKGELDDVRARGLAVRPFCPFVRGYIQKHPAEYADLVPSDEHARFGIEV